MDIKKKDVSDIPRPGSATRTRNHGADRVNDCAKEKGKTKPKQQSLDKINHDDLEQEYLDLRRKLAQPSNADSDANKVNGIHRAQREVLADTTLSTTPIEHFKTDILGINHFKQHLVNVKATSKKAKRQNTHNALSEQAYYRQGRRNSLKFKPLYEKHHLDENEPVTTSDKTN